MTVLAGIGAVDVAPKRLKGRLSKQVVPDLQALQRAVDALLEGHDLELLVPKAVQSMGGPGGTGWTSQGVELGDWQLLSCERGNDCWVGCGHLAVGESSIVVVGHLLSPATAVSDVQASLLPKGSLFTVLFDEDCESFRLLASPERLDELASLIERALT